MRQGCPHNVLIGISTTSPIKLIEDGLFIALRLLDKLSVQVIRHLLVLLLHVENDRLLIGNLLEQSVGVVLQLPIHLEG